MADKQTTKTPPRRDNYRTRVRQCEALGEFALAENIRQILVNEQEHQIDLATALGKNVPDVASYEEQA